MAKTKWKLKKAAALDPKAQGLMKTVMREHHKRLAQQNLVLLFMPEPKAHKGRASIGHATATGVREQLLSEVDGCITIAWSWWQKANNAQREAQLDHDLSHFECDEKTDKLRTVGHDVEAFISVWRRRGPWTPELAQAESVMQLRLPGVESAAVVVEETEEALAEVLVEALAEAVA